MNKLKELIFKKKYPLRTIQFITCVFIVLFLSNNLILHGLSPYQSYSEYFHQNSYKDETSCAGVSEVRQEITSKGNLLTNMSLYLGDVTGSKLQIQLLDGEKVLFTTEINESNLKSNTWNTIPVDCNQISKDAKYVLKISGNDLSSLRLSTSNDATEVFGKCVLDNNEYQGTLVFGLQNTYRFVSLGSALYLAVNIAYILIFSFLLCFAVFNIDKLYDTYLNSEKKTGLLYALYFSVYTVLLFNPLEKIRNQITEFERVIGGGINAGVDVSKRTDNFNLWFVYFAVAFVLFYLLANYLKRKFYSEESKKAIDFLDNVIVLANVILALRCISFFYKEVATFVYSEYIILLVVFVCLAYIFLKIDKRISEDIFLRLMVSGLMISYPISILISKSFSDKALIAVQVIISLVILIATATVKVNWSNKLFSSVTATFVMFLSMIPLATSFFIEMVVVLNQHKIFLASPRRYYFLLILFGLIITVIASVLIYKKSIQIKSWKRFVYPSIVFGIACLWQQIPISAIYNADIYESAGASILVSDFLNNGNIPLVQHYGGHMMTSVWEGILYGLINNDYSGAIFTPYYGLFAASVAVLFFYLIKRVWNEDAAILTVLFFPFYSSCNYWALGVLICLAAMLYVNKNTWPRAIFLWFTIIWCIIYRLDLGFAFAFAGIVALLFYIFSTKNAKATRQLTITLLAWVIGGVTSWFLLCLGKQVDPVARLKEFISISLSNQNWAYASIGDAGLITFSWIYLFIPFAVIGSLIFAIFSRDIKKYLGNSKWVLMLTLGFAFAFNFSRGLVRHSLVEMQLNITIFTAFVFLAFFLAAIRKNDKLFLPAFAVLLVSSALFLDGHIFTETSIADYATNRIGTFTDTWYVKGGDTKTYWQEVQENGEVIDRTVMDETLRNKVENYKIVIDTLLDQDETFVDFINKSFLYSALGRVCPVYVSQSPLQLSGEFTQEQFVQQIEGVPIVLMPYDNSNYRESSSLDGIANAYRYYKVSEYIYRNYVPLCTYKNDYAVWCLPERHDEMLQKLQNLSSSDSELMDTLANAKNLELHSAEVVTNSDGSININSTDADPFVAELQLLLDITPFINKSMDITIDYETDVLTEMQLFYTTAEGEGFSAEKVLTVGLNSQGTAEFTVPVTEFTRLRLDTPDGSKVKISSFRTEFALCELTDYGYDGPYLTEDGVSYRYLPGIHEYFLNELPLIWGKADKEQSVNNHLISDLEYFEGAYRYDIDTAAVGDNGNYLKVSADFYGYDKSGQFESDDESTSALIKVGRLENGKFETKYVYYFTIEEGQHDYMFRISSDYYWYIDQTNAVVLECGDPLLNLKMQVLEGD